MKRYINGVMTGALVGAVVTSVWLMQRKRSHRARWRVARQWGPRIARLGTNGLRGARRHWG